MKYIKWFLYQSLGWTLLLAGTVFGIKGAWNLYAGLQVIFAVVMLLGAVYMSLPDYKPKAKNALTPRIIPEAVDFSNALAAVGLMFWYAHFIIGGIFIFTYLSSEGLRKKDRELFAKANASPKTIILDAAFQKLKPLSLPNSSNNVIGGVDMRKTIIKGLNATTDEVKIACLTQLGTVVSDTFNGQFIVDGLNVKKIIQDALIELAQV